MTSFTSKIKVLGWSVLAWLGLVPVWPWSGLGLVLVLVWLWSGPGLALVWSWSGSWSGARSTQQTNSNASDYTLCELYLVRLRWPRMGPHANLVYIYIYVHIYIYIYIHILDSHVAPCGASIVAQGTTRTIYSRTHWNLFVV